MKKKNKAFLSDEQNKHQSAASANNQSAGSTNGQTEKDKKSISRRNFIRRGAALGALTAGFLAVPNLFTKSAGSSAQASSDCFGCEIVPYVNGEARADAALKVRISAARYERYMPIPSHPCNGDEKLYSDRNYFASYTKGIQRAYSRPLAKVS